MYDVLLGLFGLVAGILCGIGYARREQYTNTIKDKTGIPLAVLLALALSQSLAACAASPASVAFGSHAGRALRALCGIAPAILPTLDRMADAEVADPDAGSMPAAAALDAGVPAIGGE